MLYPFEFEPIFKRTIWGGNRLSRFKHLSQPAFGVGESWEISQVEGDVSVLANGPMKGTTLSQLLEQFPEEILGKKVYARFGTHFPLLFKFIDAKRDLSVQVHPDDAMAKKYHGPQASGKTEMWYVIEAEPYAALIAGFSRNLSNVEYQLRMKQNRIEEVLRRFKVQAGDAFFIPPGLVHSIGGGILLLEIQQTSDLTYRMYDYNRVDAEGKKRELHTDLAAEALDYSYHPEVKLNYALSSENEADLMHCEHFNTNVLCLQAGQSMRRDKSAEDSFVVYNCVQGSVRLSCAMSSMEPIVMCQGKSVLVPAALAGNILLEADSEAILVETTS